MARIADAVGAPREDVELAVAEAVGNAVVHGYPGSDGGRIVVRAEVSSAKLTITVADDGSGLRPDPASPGLGLGLPLIARVSSRYRIEAGPEGGTVVAMEFRRGGASGG